MKLETGAFALGLAFAAGACASTDRGEAASIYYRMPETKAHATLTLVLQECGSSPSIKSDLALTFSGAAGNKIYKINGSKLSSALIARNLTVELDADGAIKSINSVNADKTADVIKNALSIATTVAKLEVASVSCSKDTLGNFEAVEKLKAKISAARAKLAEPEPAPKPVPTQPSDATSASVKATRAKTTAATTPSTGQTPASANDMPDRDKADVTKQINAWAKEVARIKNDELTITLEADLDLSKPPGTVDFEYGKIAKKWLTGIDAKKDFGVTWSSVEITPTGAAVTTATKKKCSREILLPASQFVKFTLSLAGERYPRKEKEPFQPAGAKPEEKTLEEFAPVAQWSKPEPLCLDANFGEKTDLQLTFDDFGRKTKFVWASGARAEEVSSGASTVVTGVSGYLGATKEPSAVATQKSQIEALETKQKLNKLLACQAIIDAGGYDCDKRD